MRRAAQNLLLALVVVLGSETLLRWGWKAMDSPTFTTAVCYWTMRYRGKSFHFSGQGQGQPTLNDSTFYRLYRSKTPSTSKSQSTQLAGTKNQHSRRSAMSTQIFNESQHRKQGKTTLRLALKSWVWSLSNLGLPKLPLT